MMTTLDRMFLVSYFRSYAIVVSCLLSLYVVIDLFTNIDSFGQKGGGFASVAEHVIVVAPTRNRVPDAGAHVATPAPLTASCEAGEV